LEPCGQQTGVAPEQATPQSLQLVTVPRVVSQSGAVMSQSRTASPHMHAYEPELLLHIPPAPQGVPVAHSFTSTHVALRPLPESVKPAAQVQV
jgi:hypothetical protein